MNIRSNAELIESIFAGQAVEYLFFWGHQIPKSGVSKSCFSQWYPSPFEMDGVTYKTAEHFMMAGKARLFGDTESLEKIIASDDPRDAKKLGRGVTGFVNETWEANRYQIVLEGNVAKFSQNRDMKAFLLGTGDKIIVEASPYDRIWGIGLNANDEAASDPTRWDGLNLLGYVLMDVREQLGGTEVGG